MHGLSNLPEDVVLSILVRLPARSIARCRAVCRAWRSAVSHPSFDRLRAHRPATVAKVTVATDDPAATETTVAFDFFRGRWHRDKTTLLPSPRTLRFTPCDYPSRVAVVGSWDGIVCIQRQIWKPAPPGPGPGPGYHIVDQYTLWNPLTMACADASAPTTTTGGGVGGGGIIGAYAHPSTRRFHLLHASRETDSTAVRIARVGDATTWRDLPLDLDGEILRKNTYDAPHAVGLHGNLHWLVRSGSGSGSTLRLLVFHTAHEKFRLMEAPERRRRRRADLTTVRLGALSGGELCFFDLEASTGTMDVWVLDDYDAVPQGSWRLKVRIDLAAVMWKWNEHDLSRAFYQVEVVQSVHGGEEIFLHRDGLICAYNLVDQAWTMVNVSKSSYSTDVSLVMHRESLLPGDVSFGEASSPPLSPVLV